MQIILLPLVPQPVEMIESHFLMNLNIFVGVNIDIYSGLLLINFISLKMHYGEKKKIHCKFQLHLKYPFICRTQKEIILDYFFLFKYIVYSRESEMLFVHFQILISFFMCI
jgi:hypothetical protein